MQTTRQLGEEYPPQDSFEPSEDEHSHHPQLGAYDFQPNQPQDHSHDYQRRPAQTFARQH